MSYNFKQILGNIPEAKAPEVNVVDVLSRLRSEVATDDDNKKIKISYEFLDTTNDLFGLGGIEKEWYSDLMGELKMLTSITRKQLFGEYKKKFKPHPYSKVDLLNYKDEFLINPQYEAFQLRLTKSTGRIHGFFVGNIFYIRFFDRWHNMYDVEGYPGIQYYGFPMTVAEKQEIELRQKNDEIDSLKDMLNQNAELLCDNCSDCSKGVFKRFKI